MLSVLKLQLYTAAFCCSRVPLVVARKASHYVVVDHFYFSDVLSSVTGAVLT